MSVVLLYTLFEQKDTADVVKKLSEEASEESSDDTSTSQNRENSKGASSSEGRQRRWRRRGTWFTILMIADRKFHCLVDANCDLFKLKQMLGMFLQPCQKDPIQQRNTQVTHD